MKAIDLSSSTTTLAELLSLAAEENIVVRTADGREFVVAEVDDFEDEVSLVRKNEALMQLLADRSKEEGTLSMDDVKARLGL